MQNRLLISTKLRCALLTLPTRWYVITGPPCAPWCTTQPGGAQQTQTDGLTGLHCEIPPEMLGTRAKKLRLK